MREARLDSERQKKRRKFDALGIEQHVCVLCPEDDVLCMEVEHPAGRAHDDAVRLLCTNCHRKRTAHQRCDPSASPNRRNVFEVIGRWLLSMAAYFELLCDRLRCFGEFLINLAKVGYGDEFDFNAEF